MRADLVRPPCNQVDFHAADRALFQCFICRHNRARAGDGAVVDGDMRGFRVLEQVGAAGGFRRLHHSAHKADVALVHCAVAEGALQNALSLLRLGEHQQPARLVVQPMARFGRTRIGSLLTNVPRG